MRHASRVRCFGAPALVLALLTFSLACKGEPPGRPRPLKVAYFGDSVALTYAGGAVTTNATAAGDILVLHGSVRLGCPIGRYTLEAPYVGNPGGVYTEACDWSQDVTVGTESRRSYANEVKARHPDLAVVYFCGWDIVPRRIPLEGGGHDPEFREVGDPIYDAFLEREFRAMTDELLGAGARGVAVLTCGELLDAKTKQPRELGPQLAQWNVLLRRLPQVDPRIKVVDAAAWLDAQPDPFRIRPDGEHFEADGPRLLADGYVDAQLLLLADQFE